MTIPSNLKTVIKMGCEIRIRDKIILMMGCIMLVITITGMNLLWQQARKNEMIFEMVKEVRDTQKRNQS